MKQIKTYSYLQVDDYLDLLNYAKQLNDIEWQEELKEALQHQLLENGKETILKLIRYGGILIRLTINC
ncbi:hypothetical protein [Paenibacillus sp. TY11]|uniref:hypothetical protein n=1 Tax=Paenibacillus sp. TY11 TaxID=3448633 RepID=UPI004039ECDC